LEFDDYYVIIPEIYSANPELLKKIMKDRKGKTVPENFAYTSDGNSKWLKVEELRKIITYPLFVT
jgi:UDP-N-acetylglucosamine 4,6-dehydratase/5-epimerase